MAFVANDSFTTQARVEALVARGAHDATTKPTGQDVLDRMAGQAARVAAVLAEVGHSGTVPSGASALTDLVLARLCDEANAFLAAAYVIEMHDVRDTDKQLVESYLSAAVGDDGESGLLGAIRGYLSATLTVVSLSGRAYVSTPEFAMDDLLHVARPLGGLMDT